MNWKQRYAVKIPLYFITILAMMVALVTGVILLIGYDQGIFTTTQYTQTSLCKDQVNEQMWNTCYRLDLPHQWARDTATDSLGEDARSTPEWDVLYQEHYAESLDQILESIAQDFDSDMSNFQVRILDNATGAVLVDTFQAVDYHPLQVDKLDAFTVQGALATHLVVEDVFWAQSQLYGNLMAFFPGLWYAFGVSVALIALGFGLIMSTAGHRKEKEGVTTGVWEKIPSDIWMAGAILIGVGAVVLGVNAVGEGWCQQSDFAYLVAMVALFVTMLTLFCGVIVHTLSTFAVRVKTGTLFYNTLVAGLVRWAKTGLSRIPTLWRTLLIGLAICAINGILGMWCMSGFFPWLIFALYNLLMVIALCALSWQMKLLQSGANSLTNGHLAEKIDTNHLYIDFKALGETLNTIGDGLGLAVDEKLKSQRMKTELITNVSHDIKTPLTSIVTCVELLQQEHDETQHQEYLDLLQRQSMKMKKLVEDLVEASKASTGNLPVHLQETDLVEVVEQALGEYVGRFEERNLTVVTDLPELCTAQADGKLMWRVLDNLLSNVCKYALPGTRVYLALTSGERCELSLKNISAQPLNLTADQLMERFVRGDSARTTEGSGLGLNIAQSLMQLQKGSLALYIDGDLVKVQLFL